MVSKRQGGESRTSELRWVQREREREKRRMRDRQRRQNMSLEQRERHLARRRRNYQLRRVRASTTHNPTSPATAAGSHHLIPFSSGMEQHMPARRLRMHQIRQLARLLHTHASKQMASDEGANKRLRFTHIKRLARALKSHNH